MIRKLLLGAFAALILGLVGLGFGARTASAEVIENGRYTVSYPVTNPCNGLVMTLQGEFHMVWYTTPEDTVIMRYNAHYTATDSAGTEYVVNVHHRMEHWEWPSIPPFSDLIVWNVASKGDSVNARIELTVEYSTVYPAPQVVNWVCRG